MIRSRSNLRGPASLAAVSAILWGLWWLPIRLIEDMGLTGAWAGLTMTLGALPVLAALLLLRQSPTGPLTAGALAGALLVGLAVSLYAMAITFTDVVRAVLLFYLAPAWSITIECAFMGRRWNWRTTLALSLSLVGLFVVFRGDVSLAGFRPGDLIALGSGLAWSAGSALIFSSPDAGSTRLSFVTLTGSVLAAGLTLLVAGAAAGEIADIPSIAVVSGVAVLSGTIYMAPIILITLWAARRLPPATMSFILTLEILSGIGSSALFLDERFGLPEAIGGILIIAGALVEVMVPTGVPTGTHVARHQENDESR